MPEGFLEAEPPLPKREAQDEPEVHKHTYAGRGKIASMFSIARSLRMSGSLDSAQKKARRFSLPRSRFTRAANK